MKQHDNQFPDDVKIIFDEPPKNEPQRRTRPAVALLCRECLTHTARSFPQSPSRALQSGALLRPVHHGVRSSRRRRLSAVKVAACGSSCLQPLARCDGEKTADRRSLSHFSEHRSRSSLNRSRHHASAITAMRFWSARTLRSQCVKLRLAMYDKLLGQPLSNEQIILLSGGDQKTINLRLWIVPQWMGKQSIQS